VGGNPTFGESDRKVEVHLLAFDGDLYGQELTVEFLKRVRETREFGSVDELKDQLAKDIEAVWVYLESDSAEGVGTGESGGDELS
jgi:riboflavin kinase/FMN adenylyltransferase